MLDRVPGMIRWPASAAALLGALLSSASAQAADRLSFAVPGAGAGVTLQAELYRLPSPAPAPAVVLMHGCSGVNDGHRRWAEVLNGFGYAALVVDSFGGRGVNEVCTGQQAVAPRARVQDIDAAAAWLQAQAFVRRDRIGLIGYSHGGATTLFADLVGGESPPTPRFVAAVAFYPDCTMRGTWPTQVRALRPLLILIGEKDDWTLAEHCRALMQAISGASAALEVYPDAVHGFDVVGSRPRFRADVRNRNKPGGCCGASLGFEPEAYRRSVERVRMFFAEQLAH